MTKEEKGVIIKELAEKFSKYSTFYITDAAGLSVNDINNFRKLCYKKGIEYKVVKNSLIKKALADVNMEYASLEKSALKGFSGILFADTGNAPAKLLKEFYKTGKEKPSLKGASVEGSYYIGVDQLDALSTVKSREELIGEIIGLLQSPAKNVISALQSSGNKLSGIVKTLSERPE